MIRGNAEREMQIHEARRMQEFRELKKEEQEKRDKGSKQVIVMRTDLNMRKGKMIAQGAHASLKVMLDMMEQKAAHEPLTLDMGDIADNGVGDWLFGKFTKICCRADSEDELRELYEKAKAAGLPCSLILDAAVTEFKEPTYTCIAVGPAWSRDIDEVTGHLKLL